MRRRRKQVKEHDNPDRWMVSYADFITLMFAFFVVMYAVAAVNQGQYRVLSDSIVSAFRSISIVPGGQHLELPPVFVTSQLPLPIQEVPREAARRETGEVGETTLREVRDIADEIRRVLGPVAQEGQITVSDGAQGITVEINASVLFAAGEATLNSGALPALRAVAGVLADASFPITVEGHTDNVPIATFRFPSNWELSSARASSVVRLFVEAGIEASRLTAAGYADQRPIADNTDEAGRARNRRVTLYIESRFIEPGPPATPGRIRVGDPMGAILPGQ